MDFSIILINYNSVSYIEKCLDHIRDQDFMGSIEIMVINNLSTDGSEDILKKQKDIELVNPGKNLGYSGGNNLGIKKTRGEYILCLNFDCFLEKSFLSKVYTAFETNPSVGMISGKLRKLAGHKKTMYLDSTGISFASLIPADRGEWEYDRGQYDDQTSIFGPSGAAGCYRRKSLEDIVFRGTQYFDEQMFTYCEDIDLAWRLNLAGWSGLHLPGALAHHERGATRKDSLLKKLGYYTGGFSNRLFTILKNLRRQDAKGYGKKLIKQEWRFLYSWSRRSLARWTVVVYVILRLGSLVCRPSFIAKRRLAQLPKNCNHLDLSLDVDHWDDSYQRRRLPPLPSPEDGIALTGLEVNKDAWSASAAGFANTSWGNSNFFTGSVMNREAYLEFKIPQQHQEQGHRAGLYLVIYSSETIVLHFQASSSNGSTARSDWWVLEPGKGAYTFNLERCNLTPGLDNLLAWQDHWNSLRLAMSTGPGCKITIDHIFFSPKRKTQPSKDQFQATGHYSRTQIEDPKSL